MERSYKIASNVLLVVGIVMVAGAVLFPQGVADSMATINIDTTPPTIVASNPVGSQSSPTRWAPNKTVTLKFSTKPGEGTVNNPRAVVAGSTVSMSLSGSTSTPYGTVYYYTASWDTTGHTGNTVKVVFKGEDSAGNTGTDTAYAKVASLADGYFTINGTKVSEGGTLTLTTKSINVSYSNQTSTSPDSVRLIIKDSSGSTLLDKKQSSGFSWSYTFSSDGTYTVNGYVNSYNQQIKALELHAGINSSPVPSGIPMDAVIFGSIGAVLALLGAGLRAESFRKAL